MYNPDQKQYILKNSFGVSYHVYFEQGRGLCIRMLSDSRIWSRGYVLDRSAINDFAVALDKNDIFHFVFQTDKGNIMYGHGMHGQIEISGILTSKEAATYLKNVSLLISDNMILFFYIIKHQNQHIISMQSIQNGTLSKPLAIDYVDKSNYISFLDTTGKCHLIYINNQNNKMQINHRTIKDDFSIFNAPDIIYSCEGDIRSLSTILTHTNKAFITFEVSRNESYEVMFKGLLQAKQAKIFYNSKTPPGNTGLVYSGGFMYFYRIVKESIYFMYSDNDGSSWSNEALYAALDNALCFSYISNYSKEEEICSKQIPGNFSRGYSLAFLSDENIKNIQEIKKLAKTEDHCYSDLKSKVLQLQNLTNFMEKELTKLWATQKISDRKVEHLNRMYEQLHDIINYEHANVRNGENEENEGLDKNPPFEYLDDTSKTCQIEDINSTH